MTPRLAPLKRFVDPSRPITYGIVQAGDNVPDGVPYIRPIDMTDHDGIPEPERLPRTSQAIAATYSRSEVRSGDLIVSIGPSFGKVMIVPDELNGANLTQGTARVAPAAGINGRWLYWALQSSLARSYWSSAVGGATFRALNLGPLTATPLPMTDDDVQLAMADFLDRETVRIDAVVGKKQSLLDELAERRRSIVFHGVAGQLSASNDFHDPGLPWARAVRRPWLAVRIKHVAELGTGHTPSRSHLEYWENCTIPWITTGEIQQVRDDRAEVITDTREKISALGLANSAAALHPAGTVVLCRTASAGFSAIMGEEMATSQDFATWTCSDRLLPRYLLMCLRAMRRDLLGRLAFGSTHKTIYMPDIEGLKIPLPTVEEQREVLADMDRRLEKIDALTKRLQHQLGFLSEHRQALITAAVRGELHVT